MDIARDYDDEEEEDIKPGKQGIVLFLEAWDAARSLPTDRALALAEAGTPPTAPAPFALGARFLPPPTAAALEAWANALPFSARACFAALFEGSGFISEGEVVRLRRLTGPTGAHHGLRPIRIRLVAYLVAPPKARALAPEVAAALAFIAPAAAAAEREKESEEGGAAKRRRGGV